MSRREALIWQKIELDTSGLFSLLHLPHGPFFWVHIAYSYLSLLGGTILLLRTLVRSPQLYRRQAGIILFGAFKRRPTYAASKGIDIPARCHQAGRLPSLVHRSQRSPVV